MSDFKIKDGTGSGYLAKVSADNKLEVDSVVTSSFTNASIIGIGTNIVTSVISLTTANESGVFYAKNTSASYDLVCESFAVGVGKANGTVSNPSLIRIYANPTGGTLISNATAISINNNRNFAKVGAFSGLLYEGTEGATVTGASQVATLFQNHSGRLLASLNFVVPENNSVALTVQPNCDSGTDVYVALISYYIARGN